MMFHQLFLKMLTLFVTLLVILPMTNALKPCSKDGKPCTWRHFKNVSIGNQALRPSKLISSHNVHRLGECHILCITQDNCYGYNFRVRPSNKYTVNCQISNSSLKMNMTRMKNGSWIYYEDVLVTEDVDECANGTHECSKKANCTNTPGSYNCQCYSGYKGNGKKCSEIDECSDKSKNACDGNANCTNTPGSYQCKCRRGFSGNGRSCTEINECSEGLHTCDRNANCTNTQGSYDCQCRRGYSGDGHTCSDIEECSDGSHTCDSNANCINTQGSYKCECRESFSGDGHTCTVDHCAPQPCNAKEKCINGTSYECICLNGYFGQQKTCSDILENETLSFRQNLSGWLPQEGNWTVCWRATRDGWAGTTFHARCDGKKPTLTIVKVVKNSKHLIFGGYSTESWAGNNDYASAPGSFLFSLRNNDDLSPFKSELNGRDDGYAIYSGIGYGPTFGGGHDLYISYNARSTGSSYANIGQAYGPPTGYTYQQTNTRSLLGGSTNFIPSEVEVLYLN